MNILHFIAWLQLLRIIYSQTLTTSNGISYYNTTLSTQLESRLSILRLYHPNVNQLQNCSSTNRYIIITEYEFGRSGNNMIEFTHGLYVAKHMNSTLVVPKWMSHILQPFYTTQLSKYYCYIDSSVYQRQSHHKVYEITSEDSFFTYKLFNDPIFADYLPNLNPSTLNDISLHFCQVFATLWSEPILKIKEASLHIITHHLDNNFRYTAAHKRQLEGACSKLLNERTKLTDYDPFELSMFHGEWYGNLHRNHPLCDMSIDFIHSTQDLHRSNQSKVFLAFDGRGEIESYKQHHVVFSDQVLESMVQYHKKVDLRFVDMFIAMNSELFILNPYSTFSWAIYIIRTCLGLKSVPIIKNNDFYLQKSSDVLKTKRPLWVSWTSIIEALHNHKQPVVRS